jgi:hypothetical protein
LAEFWAAFNPDDLDPKKIFLRYRSAPWDDIMDEEVGAERYLVAESTDYSDTDEQELQGSPTFNLLPGQPLLTAYKSVAVPAIPPVAQDKNFSTYIQVLKEGVPCHLQEQLQGSFRPHSHQIFLMRQ